MIEVLAANTHYGAFGTHLPRALPTVSSEGSWPWRLAVQIPLHRRILSRTLTVKLSGRAMPPDQRRGRTLPRSSRGAPLPMPHGPLQRLLGAALTRIDAAPAVALWGAIRKHTSGS